MPDNGKQSDTDLFGSEEADASADAGTTQQEDDLLEEENQTEPSEKKEKAADTAAIQTQKNVDHWVNEITSGRKSLTDLPTDKQWLKTHIEAKLGAIQKEPEIDKLIDERLNRKEEERNYKTLRSSLQSMKLTGEQKDTVKTEFKDLRESGLTEFKALEKAMKMAGIPMDQEEQDRLILRQRMSVPRQGTGRVKDSNPKITDEDFFESTSSGERMKTYMETLRNPG